MPSYMTIVILALAASKVSTALSAPVHSSREVREQSLSYRDDPVESNRFRLPGNSVQPGDGPEAEPLKKAVGGVNGKQLALNFVVGIASSLFAASVFQDMTAGSRRAPATSSTTSTGSTLTPQSGETQYEYGQYPNQQRAVDHGKRVDFFESKARSISDNNRRATSHLELLSRADLGERRTLNELD